MGSGVLVMLGSSSMTVPARPCTASSIISNDVMTARRPPDSTNLTAASTFGPMLPLANFCSRRDARISAASTRSSGRSSWVPKPSTTWSTSVAITSTRRRTARASIAAAGPCR